MAYLVFEVSFREPSPDTELQSIWSYLRILIFAALMCILDRGNCSWNVILHNNDWKENMATFIEV